MFLGVGFTLFIYSVLVYAISVMFVYFNGPFGIIDKFRTWVSSRHATFGELFSCMFCLPVNVGIVMSVLSMVLGPSMAFTPFTLMYLGNWCYWPLILFFDGMYAGGVSYLIHTIQQKLEVNIVSDGE